MFLLRNVRLLSVAMPPKSLQKGNGHQLGGGTHYGLINPWL